jgi:hypothetical protein
MASQSYKKLGKSNAPMGLEHSSKVQALEDSERLELHDLYDH